MVTVRTILRVLIGLLLSISIAAFLCGALAFLHFYFQPPKLEARAYVTFPSPEFVNGRLVLPYTDKFPVALVATYDDELEAFLNFQFLRGRTASEGVRFLLTAIPTGNGPSYRLFVVGQDDLLTDLRRLGRLEGFRLIPGFKMMVWSASELSHYEGQSHIFEVVDSIPVQKKLEDLDPSQLQSVLAEFLVFKSQTDIRVLEDMDPKPQPLTLAEARQSAADILDVARFYDLPLDYFLGVGAMENDYMDVNGDLEHAVWKSRPQRGDIILQRRRKRVLVSDYSVGAWQITRETIRAAHQLYLRDRKRHNYSLLPDRLRPPDHLDLDSVSAPVLTTYAGLLLRENLDHFHGDVEKAIGAYNGGDKTPNLQYASMVASAADYARRVLEHAPILQSEDPSKATTAKTSKAKDSKAAAPPANLLDP